MFLSYFSIIVPFDYWYSSSKVCMAAIFHEDCAVRFYFGHSYLEVEKKLFYEVGLK